MLGTYSAAKGLHWPDSEEGPSDGSVYTLNGGSLRNGDCLLVAAGDCRGIVQVSYITKSAIPRNVSLCKKHQDLLNLATEIGVTVHLGKGV